MIVYRVTINIKTEIEESWLNWMIETHVKQVIKTGYFNDWQIQKLLLPETNENESTFVVDYITDSLEKYYEYQNKEAPGLQQEHSRRFAGKFKATRAVFQSINK